ncbi:hypothetical protein FRB91_002249 [Serendipita sp. 411]|nr:hypothetical protein FRB91_002249 [Serendipita sp. 411]
MPPRAPSKPSNGSKPRSDNPPSGSGRATRSTATGSRSKSPAKKPSGKVAPTKGPSYLARVQLSPLEAAGLSKTRQCVQEVRDETAAIASGLASASITEVQLEGPGVEQAQPSTTTPPVGTLSQELTASGVLRDTLGRDPYGKTKSRPGPVPSAMDVDDAMSVNIDEEIGRASPVALPEDFFSEQLVAGISATIEADAKKVTRVVQIPHAILEDSSQKVLLESAIWMKRFEECRSHGDILRAVPDKYVESLKDIVSGFWKDTRAHAAAKTALIRVKQHQRKGTFPSMFNSIGIPSLQFSLEYTADGMTTFNGDVSDSIKDMKRELLQKYLKEKMAKAAFFAEKCKVANKAKELEKIILGRMKTLVARYPPREDCTAELKRVIDNLVFNGRVLAHCSTIILARIVQINESHEEEKLAETLEKMEIGQQATAQAQQTDPEKTPSADAIVKKMLVELDKRGLMPNKKSPGKKNSQSNAASSPSKKQQQAKGRKNDGKPTTLPPLGKKSKAQQAKVRQQQKQQAKSKKGKGQSSARK